MSHNESLVSVYCIADDATEAGLLTLDLAHAGYEVERFSDVEALCTRLAEAPLDPSLGPRVAVVVTARRPLRATLEADDALARTIAGTDVRYLLVGVCDSGETQEARHAMVERGWEAVCARPVSRVELTERVRGAVMMLQRSHQPSSQVDMTEGSLEAHSVGELVRAFVASGLSGRIEFSSGEREGYAGFESGRIVDASAGESSGVEALLRLFAWANGTFCQRVGAWDGPTRVTGNTEALIAEAVAYASAVERERRRLPEMTGRFRVRWERVRPLPISAESVFRRIDQGKPLGDALAAEGGDDLSVLEALAARIARGALVPRTETARTTSASFIAAEVPPPLPPSTPTPEGGTPRYAPGVSVASAYSFAPVTSSQPVNPGPPPPQTGSNRPVSEGYEVRHMQTAAYRPGSMPFPVSPALPPRPQQRTTGIYGTVPIAAIQSGNPLGPVTPDTVAPQGYDISGRPLRSIYDAAGRPITGAFDAIDANNNPAPMIHAAFAGSGAPEVRYDANGRPISGAFNISGRPVSGASEPPPTTIFEPLNAQRARHMQTQNPGYDPTAPAASPRAGRQSSSAFSLDGSAPSAIGNTEGSVVTSTSRAVSKVYDPLTGDPLPSFQYTAGELAAMTPRRSNTWIGVALVTVAAAIVAVVYMLQDREAALEEPIHDTRAVAQAASERAELLNRAADMLDTRKDSEARTLLQTALARDPNDGVALLQLGVLEAESGRAPHARDLLSRYLRTSNPKYGAEVETLLARLPTAPAYSPKLPASP